MVPSLGAVRDGGVRGERLNWLVATLGYIVALGALGVTSKLALRDMAWQDLVPWSAVAYCLGVAVLTLTGEVRFGWHPGTGWAVVSAGFAITSLVMLYVALTTGDASKVIPVSAAYPAVTLILSAIFLTEHISLARVGGMLLIVAGVVLVTATR